MRPNRREFLEGVTAGAVLAGLGVAMPGTLNATALPLAGDPDAGTDQDQQWDLSWVGKVTGSHKAVFDSIDLEDGAGIFRAMVWRKQYAQVLGAKAEDLSSVLVIRHEAIPLAMNQDFWDRYKIGKKHKVKDFFTEKHTSLNPGLPRPAGVQVPPMFADFHLPGYQAAGGIVLACNLAFAGCVSTVAKADKLDNAEARKRALTMLVPGVTLQPSGVFATIRAQQAGCAYIKAS